MPSGYRTGKRKGKRAAKRKPATETANVPSTADSTVIDAVPTSNTEPTNASAPTSGAALSASPMFEIRDVPGKGKGMVALVNIPKDTRIIEEEPLILIQGGPIPIMNSSIERKYNALSTAKQAIFDNLHVAYPDRPHKFHQVFETNSLPAGLINGAVYESICMINHSCAPNGYHSWNANIHKETIHAIHDIEAGAEITISYGIDDTTLRDARRRRLQDQFGFQCLCALCDVSEEAALMSDARRSKILQLDVDIAASAAQMALDPVLSACREMNTLRDAEFGAGHCFAAATYYEVFQVAAGHGRLRQATDYADMMYRARLVLEGEDSPETQRMKRYMESPRSFYAYGIYGGG